MASGFVGSPDLQTSTANQEIVTNGAGWDFKYSFKEFGFMNDQVCHVKINGGSPIYLRALQGFSSNKDLYRVESFIIVEAGITFNFIGAY